MPRGQFNVDAFDDLTRENGATRVVPGTHLISKRPDEFLDDPGAPHPEETTYLTGKAGAVAVFNAHLWHGCTRNRTARTRRLSPLRVHRP